MNLKRLKRSSLLQFANFIKCHSSSLSWWDAGFNSPPRRLSDVWGKGHGVLVSSVHRGCVPDTAVDRPDLMLPSRLFPHTFPSVEPGRGLSARAAGAGVWRRRRGD